MKKAILLSLVFGFFGFVAVAGTSAYKLDNAGVDQLFAQSTDVTTTLLSGAADLTFNTSASTTGAANAMLMASNPTPVGAFLLAFFLGWLGIHRLYLGTKGSTFIGYLLTCGGLGIVAFVDWVLLLVGLINDDIDKYIDNPKFFMW